MMRKNFVRSGRSSVRGGTSARGKLLPSRGTSARRRISLSQIFLHLVILLLLVMVLVPFFLMLVKSGKNYEQDVYEGLKLTFPFHFENYGIAWLYVKNYMFNSLFVAFSVSLLSVLLSCMGAYAFARYDMPLKNLVYTVLLAVLMVPSVLTLTTKYLLVGKQFGLLNNYFGIILPVVAGLLPFGIMLMRSFFQSLPGDLFDAVGIDGGNVVTQFFVISLPLALPMLLTLALMNFMTNWNDYLWPRLIMTHEDMQTIPVGLMPFTEDFYQKTQYYGPPLAGYVIVSLPLIVLFAFTSKQFIGGLTSGALNVTKRMDK